MDEMIVFRDDVSKQKAVDYLLEELVQIKAARGGREEKWQVWRRQRDSRPRETVKKYPWPNCSNTSVPLAQINTNGLVAFLEESFGGMKPFFTIDTDDVQFKKEAAIFTEFFDALIYSERHVNIEDVKDTLFYDLVSLGTQVVTVPWVKNVVTVMKDNGDGTIAVENLTKRNSPAIVVHRLEDVYVRDYVTDIDTCNLFAVSYRFFKHELEQLENDGFFQNVAEVFGNPKSVTDGDNNRAAELEQHGGLTSYDNKEFYEIFQCYVYTPIEEGGRAVSLVIWIEPDTGTIVKASFESTGERDPVRFVFDKVPHEFYGKGAGFMCELLQEEADTLHNMAIDGAHIEMLQMYITRRGSGLGPKEKFYPLKQIEVDNPATDFIPVKFPSVGAAAFQREMLVKEYAERVTGASDYRLGFENRNIATKATATGTMFLAQQGAKVFNSRRLKVERSFNAVAKRIVNQLILHQEELEDILNLVAMEKRDVVRKLLSMSIVDFHKKFSFSIKVTPIDKTEEARKQAILTLIQLYNMYMKETFNTAMLAFRPDVPPELRQMAMEFIVVMKKMMQEVLVFFDKKDTDSYLPTIRNIEMMVEAMRGMREMSYGVQPGGSPAGSGAPQPESRPSGSPMQYGGPQPQPVDSN